MCNCVVIAKSVVDPHIVKTETIWGVQSMSVCWGRWGTRPEADNI